MQRMYADVYTRAIYVCTHIYLLYQTEHRPEHKPEYDNEQGCILALAEFINHVCLRM